MNSEDDEIKKITIFVGEIGSGKTEFAINFGIKIKENNKKVELIDLDLHKPYIRLRDLKEEVEKYDIKVVTPPEDIKRADLPLIIHASKSCIYSEDTLCVYDIGGGEGASYVLRQFPEIEEFPYDLLYVVNIYRPFTKEKDEIIKNIKEIEKASGFVISGIVSNSNLREKTKMNEDEIRKKVLHELDLVGLSGAENNYPAELSGGMIKRTALARALVRSPEIMIFDEPTTGLDPIIAHTILDLITSIHQDLGFTGIIVSHELSRIFQIAHKVAMLNEGVIWAIGTPEEILSSPDPIVQQFIQGAIGGPGKLR